MQCTYRRGGVGNVGDVGSSRGGRGEAGASWGGVNMLTTLASQHNKLNTSFKSSYFF